MLERDRSLQQIAIVGLGRFGLTVARSLHARGHEVLGIDASEEAVQQAKDTVTHAVQVALHDAALVRELGLHETDAAVVAIGEDVEANIFCTALLLEAGVPHIVARAGSALHARILERIGAHQVVYPEADSGEAVARGLRARGVSEHIEFSPEIGISKLHAPHAWAGRTLSELQLSDEDPAFIALAVQRGREILTNLRPDERVAEGDVLAILCRESRLDELPLYPSSRR